MPNLPQLKEKMTKNERINQFRVSYLVFGNCIFYVAASRDFNSFTPKKPTNPPLLRSLKGAFSKSGLCFPPPKRWDKSGPCLAGRSTLFEGKKRADRKKTHLLPNQPLKHFVPKNKLPSKLPTPRVLVSAGQVLHTLWPFSSWKTAGFSLTVVAHKLKEPICYDKPTKSWTMLDGNSCQPECIPK